MDQQGLKQLLEEVQSGATSLESALDKLKKLPYEDLDFARIDHHRALRNGFPEVVFCQGKRIDQVVAIMQSLARHNPSVMGTRASREVYQAVAEAIPAAVYHDLARIIEIGRQDQGNRLPGRILVMSAGTADLPVAEEAAITATVMGAQVDRLYDVGVAGIHRLFAQKDKLFAADVIVVAAGMEGALASIVGGLVDVPVIALPTSVGYGASLGGIAALLSMLNSCAAGVGVVNIDNGFGAGVLATSILRTATKLRDVKGSEQHGN